MNSSQAKALVYYMFAALGGDIKAQMALVRSVPLIIFLKQYDSYACLCYKYMYGAVYIFLPGLIGGRHDGLMVSALDFRLSNHGLSPGPSQCVEFFGKAPLLSQ